MTETNTLVPLERIEQKILRVRECNVMMDQDLAELYGVETKTLNRAVQRNLDRFPDDFMFQLTPEEFTNLRYHFGTSSSWGGRRYPPYAFTEQGVAMLSTVLNSSRAVHVNIQIMRTFVNLRRMLASNEDLARKLAALEKKYDSQFKIVFDAIRQLMTPQQPPKRKIGFKRDER
ncbi:MAG: ORF6N domain-containing protein [Candidatus Hydrogenedentes bacterium]|nr:ORF6N domain-containing protein [Candidatus Hydrogenedentota bacterium]